MLRRSPPWSRSLGLTCRRRPLPPETPHHISAGSTPSRPDQQMLTNIGSDRVRSVRALSRRAVRERAGLFLVEGPQAVREVVAYRPDTVQDLYFEAQAGSR